MKPHDGAVFVVPRSVLEDTWGLLAEAGRAGFECSVVWIGERAGDHEVDIRAVWRPAQVAQRSQAGVCVEVTQEGLTELIMALPAGSFVAARLHTHPRDAYHSEVDDTNMLISHPGAVSIVVPGFAAGEPELATCSVNVLRPGFGWVELSPTEVLRQIVVQ